MTAPTPPDATAITTGLAVGSTLAAIFGDTGPTTSFLVVLGLFATAGAIARLFYDATTGQYSYRRQLGFVGLSVVTAIVTALLLWGAMGRLYPTLLMGVATTMAILGPQDALRLLRGVLERVLNASAQPPGDRG